MKTKEDTGNGQFKKMFIGIKAAILVLLFHASILNSQNLRETRTSSYYTYIYKITNEQYSALFIDQAYQRNLESILTMPVDSILTDSSFKKELTNGHYVFLKTSDNNLLYELISKTDFDVCLYTNNHDLSVFIYNKKSGEPMPGAMVKINSKIIKYDTLTKTYNLNTSKREGLLSVVIGEESALFNVE